MPLADKVEAHELAVTLLIGIKSIAGYYGHLIVIAATKKTSVTGTCQTYVKKKKRRWLMQMMHVNADCLSALNGTFSIA